MENLGLGYTAQATTSLPARQMTGPSAQRENRCMLSDQSPARSILIVDDDPNFGEALAELLAEYGYSATAMPGGVEALDYLRSHSPPHAILLDLRMPTMNGWAFRAELAGEPHLEAIPVLLLSAVDRLPEHARSLGAADFLSKPVELRFLLEKLANLLR